MRYGLIRGENGHGRAGLPTATALTTLAVLTALATAGCSTGNSEGLRHYYDVRSLGGAAPATDSPTDTATDTPTGPTDPSDPIASQVFTPASPATGTASPTSAPSASYRLLADFAKKPASAHGWPADRTGALSLDDFISVFYVQDAQQHGKDLAKQRGFQGAAHTGWFNADGSQQETYLVRFSGDSGAKDMFSGLTGAWDYDGGLTTFGDGDVHGEGAVSTSVDRLGNIDVRIAFTSGAVLCEIHYWAKTADKAHARAAALAQYQALSKA